MTMSILRNNCVVLFILVIISKIVYAQDYTTYGNEDGTDYEDKSIGNNYDESTTTRIFYMLPSNTKEPLNTMHTSMVQRPYKTPLQSAADETGKTTNDKNNKNDRPGKGKDKFENNGRNPESEKNIGKFKPAKDTNKGGRGNNDREPGPPNNGKFEKNEKPGNGKGKQINNGENDDRPPNKSKFDKNENGRGKQKNDDKNDDKPPKSNARGQNKERERNPMANGKPNGQEKNKPPGRDNDRFTDRSPNQQDQSRGKNSQSGNRDGENNRSGKAREKPSNNDNDD